MNGIGSSASRVKTVQNPWPGLYSYTESQHAQFKGREKEISELFSLVKKNALTVLFGMSGTGKTSLIQAGLYPQLRHAQCLPIHIRLGYSVKGISLSEQIKNNIRTAVAENASQGIVAQELSKALSATETLWEFLHRIEFWNSRNEPVTPILAFDQFEEIFTLGQNDPRTEPFLTEFADLVENQIPDSVRELLSKKMRKVPFPSAQQPYRIIVVLRQEFVPRLDLIRFRIPSIMRDRFPLFPLKGDRACEAVEEPGKDYITPGLAQKIVRFAASIENESIDMASFEVEPSVLNIICNELFERWKTHVEQLKTDPDTLLIPVDFFNKEKKDIIDNYYKRLFADVDEATKKFIQEKLITANGFRSSIPIEEAQRDGLSEESISTLIVNKVLQMEDRFKIPHIELSHDLLAKFIRDERDKRRNKEREGELEGEVKKIKRQNFHIRIFATVLVIALCSSIFAIIIAFHGHGKTKKTLSNMDFLVGSLLREKGQTSEALDYFARSLRKDPNNYDAASSIVSVLMHKSIAFPFAKPLQHNLVVTKIAQHPFMPIVATTSDDNIVRLWNYETSKVITDTLPCAANEIAFSTDGKLLVAASDSTVKILDSMGMKILEQKYRCPINAVYCSTYDSSKIIETNSGVYISAVMSKAARYSLEPKKMRIIKVAFNSGAAIVYVLCKDSKGASFILGWNYRYNNIDTIHRFSGRVYSFEAAFSGNGRFLTIAGSNGQILDIANRKHFPLSNGPNSIDVSPDGSRFVVAYATGSAQVFSIEGNVPITQPLVHGGNLEQARFSHDGRCILTMSSDGTVIIWDASTGLPICEPLGFDMPNKEAFFAQDDGKIIALASDNSVRIWHIPHAGAITDPLKNSNYFSELIFNKDQSLILTIGDDFVLWDLNSFKKKAMWKTSAVGAEFSPSSRFLCTFVDSNITVHDLAKNSVYDTNLATRNISNADFNPDETTLIIASNDSIPLFWNFSSKSLIKLKGHHDSIYQAKFSSKGDFAATASKDSTVIIWNCSDASPLHVLRHTGAVIKLLFAKESNLLITLSSNNIVNIWDYLKGGLLKQIVHGGDVKEILISPNETFFASVSAEMVRFWNLKGEPYYQALKLPFKKIQHISFSPDGARIAVSASTSSYSTDLLQVWDLNSMQPITEEIMLSGIISHAFSQDGRKIIAGLYDHTIRVLDIGLPSTYPISSRLADVAEHISGKAASAGLKLERAFPGREKEERFRPPSSSTSPYDSIISWYFDDPIKRKISPFASQTVEEWLAERQHELVLPGSRDIAAALLLDPKNQVLSSRYACALYVERSITDTISTHAASFHLKQLDKESSPNGEIYYWWGRAHISEGPQSYPHAINELKLSISNKNSMTSYAKLELACLLLDTAVKSYNEGIAFGKTCLSLTDSIERNEDYNQNLAQRFGNNSWYALLSKRPDAAIVAGELGRALDSTKIWILCNLAHGYLLVGKTEKAWNIYRTYARRGLLNVVGGNNVAEACISDFKELRKKGFTTPELSKSERYMHAVLDSITSESSMHLFH